MTDRQRFENKAIENGATIAKSTETVLTVIASNGVNVTTFEFDTCGKFLKAYHESI